MATFKLVKHKPHDRMSAPTKKAAVGDPAPASFEIHVSDGGVAGTSNVTIFGVNDQSNQVDISGVATLTATSNDTNKVTVDTPAGMNFTETAVAVGDVSVTCTATWNDGSIGPFSADDNLTITPAPPGPVTGLSIVHNPPTPTP